MTAAPIRSPVSVPTPAADEAVTSALATAGAAMDAGRFDPAEVAFGRALEVAPDAVDALAGRAAARLALGDIAGAGSDLDAALTLAPGRADLYLARADLARRRADFPAAEADYGRAIRLDPGNAAAFVSRADLLRLTAQGDAARYQAALDDLGRAQALAADYPAPRIARARLLTDRAAFSGDPVDLDRALAELDTLPAGRGGELAALVRARILAAQGKGDDAARLLDAPVVGSVSDPPASEAARLAARAAVALAHRDWEGAISSARGAVAADPAEWDAHRTLAEALLASGQADTALAAAERLLAAWPDDGPGLFLRAAALARLGRFDEARPPLDAARRRLASSPVYLARIVQAERAMGRLPTIETPPTAGG